MSSSSASRVIVLTGASRGLGRAMAAGFVARGHTVVGCARTNAALDSLRSEFGAPHRWDAVDVADFAAVSSWAEDVLKSHGPPSLLVNNAAVMNQTAPLWEVPVDEFSRLMDVNIKGTFHAIRAFVPAMVARRSGIVVNFSSTWGRSTSPEVAPYCSSKFAIEGLTQALAQELPSGMAAIALNPGVIDTDMLRVAFGESASSYPSPDDWAERAVPQILAFTARDNRKSPTVS